MNKRLLSVAVVLAMLLTTVFSVMAVPVSAASSASFSLTNVSGKSGDIVEMNVRLLSNSYIVNGDFVFEYDASVLRLVEDAYDGEMCKINTNIFSNTDYTVYSKPADGKFVLLYASDKTVGTTASGTLLSLKFEILTDTVSSTDVTMKADPLRGNDGQNTDDYDVEYSVSGGTVTIKKPTTTTTTQSTTTTTSSTTTTTTTESTTTTTESTTTTTESTTTTTQSTTTTTESTTTTTESTTTTTTRPVVPGHVAVEVGKVSGKVGDTVTVTVTMGAVSDVAGLELHLAYDTDALDCVSAVASDLIVGAADSAMCDVNVQDEIGEIWLTAMSLNSLSTTGDEVILTLTFVIKEGAADTNPITDAGSVFYPEDTSAETPPLELDFIAGSVDLIKKLLGDVTLDGQITTADVVALRRYIIGTQELNEQQLLNGDMNEDGDWTTVDVVALRQLILTLI